MNDGQSRALLDLLQRFQQEQFESERWDQILLARAAAQEDLKNRQGVPSA